MFRGIRDYYCYLLLLLLTVALGIYLGDLIGFDSEARV